MVPHHLHRSGGSHHLCVGIPGHQLPRRNLVQRTPRRRQQQIVGMHSAHEVDVSRWVNQGGSNALAVKVTPEQALQDVDGVELADSWYDWINGKKLGYQGPGRSQANSNSFIPDRNAGIWKPVYLRVSGAVILGPATVNTELPLPRTDSARLTIYTSLRNTSMQQVRGVLRATITGPASRTYRSNNRSPSPRGRTGRSRSTPHDSARFRSPIQTFGGPTHSANPICMTCSWNSASSTGRPTLAICGSDSHRLPTSRQ